MANYRKSYWKTVLAAGAGGVFVFAVAAAIAMLALPGRGIAIALGAAVALPFLLVAVSGLSVLHRDATVASGKQDLFHYWNKSRTESAIGSREPDVGLGLRRALRAVMAPGRLIVGDEVEIRSLDEIRRTLDVDGCLDGLPFMPEMLRLCGRRARVFRRVDKIYDYGGKKVVRRLRETVLLHQMRCSGDAHGNCEAGCYLMWKEAWLKRAPALAEAESSALRTIGTNADTNLQRAEALASAGAAASEEPYRCQFTQLVSASTPINHWDPRLDLRPLAAGNITLPAFVIALLTRLFNYVQGKRGGYAYPMVESLAPAGAPPTQLAAVGQKVRVRPSGQIFATLDKNFRNRGLWFDRDMLKHCGREYEVLKRVDRIIDDATGSMRTMKTPCIVLRDVTYSGEFLRFLAQEEHLYWREAWLLPTSANRVMPDVETGTR